MTRSILMGAMLVAALSVAACSGTNAAPPTSAPSGAPTGAPTSGPVVRADDLKFLDLTVSVPAGKAFDLVLDNQEDLPHNVEILDASGASVFRGEIVSKQTITYKVPALAAGSYTFICTVHKEMKGTLTAG